MINFIFLGVRVTIHPFFWIIAIIFSWPSRNIIGPEVFAHVTFGTLVIFISIFFHEMGHALMAKKFGARPNIMIYFLGGYAQHQLKNLSRQKSVWITIAGPFANLLLIFLAYGFIIFLNKTTIIPSKFFFFLIFYSNKLIFINIFLLVINLLPIFPLDGGQILYYSINFKNWKTIYQISMITSALVALLFLTLGFGTIMLTLIFGYLAYQNYKASLGKGVPNIW